MKDMVKVMAAISSMIHHIDLYAVIYLGFSDLELDF